MKIGIAGPGRSGTSLLTLLFSEFGFHTAVENGTFHEEARAGYESRIDGTSGFDIDKDPWFFEYINLIPENVINQYELILLPIRMRQDAVISRVSQERTERVVSNPTDHWRWNSWGNTPGGAVSGIDFESVNQTLSGGLWDIVEACERGTIPYMFIHFPRFAENFEYFWSKLGHFVEIKISKKNAKQIFVRVIDLNKIRIKTDGAKTPKVLELEAVISNLQKKIHSTNSSSHETQAAHNSALAERNSAVAAANAERDAASEERERAVAEAHAERDIASAGRERAVDQANSERDSALTQRDRALEERNSAVAERNAAVAERNSAVASANADRDAAVAERNAAVAERNAAVAERNSAVASANADRDAAVAERNAAVASANSDRDAAVAERNAIVSSTIWKLFKPYRAALKLVKRD